MCCCIILGRVKAFKIVVMIVIASGRVGVFFVIDVMVVLGVVVLIRIVCFALLE